MGVGGLWPLAGLRPALQAFSLQKRLAAAGAKGRDGCGRRPQQPGGARLQGERERSPCVAPLAAGKLLPGGVNLPSRPYRTAREKTHKIKNENCNYPLAKKEKI